MRAGSRAGARLDWRSWGGFGPKIAVDAGLVSLAYVGAYLLRLEALPPRFARTLWATLPLVVSVKLLALYACGAYRSIWAYCGLEDLRKLFAGTAIGSGFVMALGFFLRDWLPMPRSLPVLDAALALLLTSGARMAVRMLHETDVSRRKVHEIRTGRCRPRRVLIVGAGDAGEMIVREMLRNARMDYRPVGFVDDDPRKRGQSIHGVQVLGNREDIPRLVKERGVEEVMVAIPSLRGPAVRRIVEVCRQTGAALKILPDLARLAEGVVHLSDFRNVEVEDLLGREPAELDLSSIAHYVRDRRVLVTGAGGSIGSELCRQLLRFRPQAIYLLGRGEHSIYEIHRELSRVAGQTQLVQIIGDVINKKKLEGVFRTHKPELVFHAGADKHVPLMELNPDEAVLNNIVGTKNVLELANELGVQRVVCISTDKAVRPTSVMGCCKRVAELLVQSAHLYPRTVPIAVRFGNVLGSRGSVVPHFERQIREGGPVTVTHRDVRRYFMTIPEAVGLVLQAGALGGPGDLFVLDMGEPVRIWELAENMIRLAGLEPGRDIEIVEVGLRPGEKLDEELSGDGEELVPTSHSKILRVAPNGGPPADLLSAIETLRQLALKMDGAGIRSVLRRIVTDYQPLGGCAGSHVLEHYSAVHRG